MITLSVGQDNPFAIYADTISNDVQTFGDYFLLKLYSLYTRHTYYVVPQILTRNTRYVKFNVEIVEYDSPDDPLNGILEIFPPGNYSYTLYNTDFATLDPGNGVLVDQGQAILEEFEPGEIIKYTYTSDNELLKNIIYYSGVANDCVIDADNSIYYIDEDMITLCQPLVIKNTGEAVIKDGFTWTFQ